MFLDRRDAGMRLARALPDAGPDALVLGIPRGGVVVARVIADAIGAPLDVIIVRKLGAPGNPELAIGAVGPDGGVVLDADVIHSIGTVSEAYVEREAGKQREEIIRRMRRYRGSRPSPRIKGRVCVVVDDGIATGSTARAAVLWLRAQRASRIVLAVPVAPAATVRALGEFADEIVCVLVPPGFRAVGEWYASFAEVGDDEVVAELAGALAAPARPA